MMKIYNCVVKHQLKIEIPKKKHKIFFLLKQKVFICLLFNKIIIERIN